MLIVAFVVASTTFAAPQVPEAMACDEACEAVLAEGLDWVFAQVEDGWDRWISEPRTIVLDLHLDPQRFMYRSNPSLYEKRYAEHQVLEDLAAARDLPAAVEVHPLEACFDTDDSEQCRALWGTVTIHVHDVEMVGPTEARVSAGMRIMRGPGILWMLHLERVDRDWKVVSSEQVLSVVG